MGTIKTKLSLMSQGSATTTASGFSVSISDSLSIETPLVNLASGSVTNSGATTIISNSVSDTTYLYLKFVSSASAADVLVVATVAGTQNVMDLTVGEAVFFPVKGSVGVSVISSSSNAISYEYGYWTKT